MLSTFGEQASRLRGALPPGIDAVVYDDNESNLADAVLEAVARRERGSRFYALALVDDLRVSVCNWIANNLNLAFNEPAERRSKLAELACGDLGVNGKPVNVMWHPLKATQNFTKINYVLALSDEVLFRSYYECSTYVREVRFNSSRYRRIALAATIPTFDLQPGLRRSVLVWTGRRETAIATLALMGLEGFDGDVAYVGDEPLPRVQARFVSRDAVAQRDALTAAGCVVCVDPADPSDAVALAHSNVPVVATLTSGAYEFVNDIVSWDAGDALSLRAAVASAFARAL